MSRTKRNKTVDLNWKCLRTPHHLNDESTLKQVLKDNYIEDYKLSGVNRIRKRLRKLPDAWEDIVIKSALDKYSSK